jgi:hypothetical protein
MITAIVVPIKGGKQISADIEKLTGKLSEEHTKLCAEEHKKELDKAIEDSRVRPTKQTGNHLKDQIQIEKILGDTAGYGVGNIETLNQKAPWWAWINFGRAGTGRTDPPSDIGSFAPGEGKPSSSSFRAGLWQHGKLDPNAGLAGAWGLNPKKAIKAHNYIEKALGVMVSKIRELLK